MAWAALDDNFDQNPKICGLSDQAFRLYVCSLSCTNRAKTGGKMTKTMLKSVSVLHDIPLRKLEKLCSELIEKGAFHEENDGYVIHDWDKYNGHVRPKMNSTERVRAFRERQRNGECNAFQDALHETQHETPPSYAYAPLPSPLVNSQLQTGSRRDSSNGPGGENAAGPPGETAHEKAIREGRCVPDELVVPVE